MKIKRYFGAGIALFRKTIDGYEVFLGKRSAVNRTDDGYELLLGKRSTKQGYGKWSIPGGGYEFEDYSYLGCANREFKEEMGRLVPDGEILGIKSFNYPFFHWKTFIFFTYDPMTDCNLSEFSEVRWIPLKEVRNYKLCFGVEQEIQKFLKLEKKNKDTIHKIAVRSDEYCMQVVNILRKENPNIIIPTIQRRLGLGFNHAKRILEMVQTNELEKKYEN